MVRAGRLECAVARRWCCARLADEHPRVREHAVRLSESLAGRFGRVRAQAGCAGRRSRHARALSTGLLAGRVATTRRARRPWPRFCAATPADPWIRLAVFSSLAEGAGEVFARSGRRQDLARERRRPRAAGRTGPIHRPAEPSRGDRQVAARRSNRSRPTTARWPTAIVRGLGEGLAKAPGTLQAQLAAHRQREGATRFWPTCSRRPARARPTTTQAAGRARRRDSHAGAGHVRRRADRCWSGLLSNRQPQDVQSAALGTLASFSDPSIAADPAGGLARHEPAPAGRGHRGDVLARPSG